MNIVLGILAILLGIAFIGLGTALAVRGVLRDKRGSSGALSAAALEVQSILEPEKKKAVETMRAMEEREDEDAATS